MAGVTIDTIQAKARKARSKPSLHGQLCGLIYARKDASDLAEQSMSDRKWDQALAAVALARDLDAEYQRKEVGP